jgi:toluene monooxygenase system protein D
MTAVSEPTSPSRNLVGPVIQAGEIADAVAAAVREDNPGKEVTVNDRGSYVRIEVDTECVIRRETLEAELGRPFRMAELEVNMPSFVGQIETASDHIRFYKGRPA